jgi:hypothetical protein
VLDILSTLHQLESASLLGIYPKHASCVLLTSLMSYLEFETRDICEFLVNMYALI